MHGMYIFLLTGLSAQVLEDYPSSGRGELSLKKGDVMIHMREHVTGWWVGRDPSGKYGHFPSMFVQVLEQVGSADRL